LYLALQLARFPRVLEDFTIVFDVLSRTEFLSSGVVCGVIGSMAEAFGSLRQPSTAFGSLRLTSLKTPA
jgi:hypothetical protein